ncbi:ribosome-inactivating family protein [Kitasatospora mediocidica]|uniref:ribosome-inactivating family protein n=1 Tax=Kitasatospora mediocidica TaxID=58352 RepID=UPI000565F821|nr:ribosome-inactivating family protein [Kitasatospora mediocidica]
MTSTLRAALTRLLAASLAVLTLAGLTATSAHADTTRPREQIIWNVHSLLSGDMKDAYGRYWSMLGALRGTVGHRVGNSVTATERLRQDGARAVEIRIMNDDQSVASLFLRSDNLYVMGVWTPSPNSGSATGAVGFHDQRAELQAILQRNGTPAAVTDLGFDSTYDALGSDTRGAVGMNGYTIAEAIRAVSGYNHNMTETAQRGFRASLIILIQAVAEAARFQDIAITVSRNIYSYASGSSTKLSLAQVNLENAWSPISRWLHAAVSPLPPGTTLATLRLDGQDYNSLEQYNMRYTYTLALGTYF